MLPKLAQYLYLDHIGAPKSSYR